MFKNFENKLDGIKVALLSTNGFEYDELTKPKQALEEAGARVFVVSPEKGSIKGWTKTNWSGSIPVDILLTEASATDFDALILPGGVMNPDKLRMDAAAVKFVKSFSDTGKPIAAICHGSQILIETDIVRGKKMTSWPSLKTDLLNAGALWIDEAVVSDRGLITSRKPDDIPAFNKKMIEEFAEGSYGTSSIKRKESQMQNFYNPHSSDRVEIPEKYPSQYPDKNPGKEFEAGEKEGDFPPKIEMENENQIGNF